MRTWAVITAAGAKLAGVKWLGPTPECRVEFGWITVDGREHRVGRELAATLADGSQVWSFHFPANLDPLLLIKAGAASVETLGACQKRLEAAGKAWGTPSELSGGVAPEVLYDCDEQLPLELAALTTSRVVRLESKGLPRTADDLGIALDRDKPDPTLAEEPKEEPGEAIP